MMTHFRLPASCAVMLLGTALSTQAATLTNGSGEGDVVVDVNAVGYIFDATFNPVGSIGAGETVYESYVATTLGNQLIEFFEDGSSVISGAEILSETASQMRSRFTVNQLEFTLTQTVSDAVSGGIQTGSVLTQEFNIRNLTDVPVSFDMFRYMDGDLYLTDDTLDDGGGVVTLGGQTIPYQNDILDGSSAENTFLGITAIGGTNNGPQNFSVNDCCDLDLPLDNAVEGDTDGDQVIDEVYDVTLALQNSFLIPVNASQTYTTTTIWGSGEVPTPGSTETIPLLPNNTVVVNEIPVWTFEIEIVDVEIPVWIDPIVAVGYTYEVTGNSFAGVTAPSLATIPDGDGTYTITAGSDIYTLLAGETVMFTTPVTSFELSGIDIALGIDPNDLAGFPLGVFFDATGGAFVTQSPIVVDTDDLAPIPLPASSLLLLAGLGSLPVLRRLKKSAA